MKLINSTIALTLTLVLNGCASYDANQAPNLANDLTARRAMVETRSVSMIAKPTHDEAALELYYGADLVKEKILPIEVEIANGASQESVRFEVDGFT